MVNGLANATSTPSPTPTTPLPDLPGSGLDNNRTVDYVAVDEGLSNGEIFLIVVGVLVLFGVLAYVFKDGMYACVIRLRRSHFRDLERTEANGEAVRERAASLEELAFGLAVNKNQVPQEVGGFDQEGEKDERTGDEALGLEDTASPLGLAVQQPCSLAVDEAPESLEPPPTKPSLEFVAASDSDDWTTEEEYTDCDSVHAASEVRPSP